MAQPPEPSQLLRRAAGPGRIRGIALDLWARARASGRAAGHVLRTGLREARALHSAERRLVQEGLYGLIRRERALAAVAGDDEPLALWLGWLVTQGLPPDDAARERPGPWDTVVDRLVVLGDDRGPVDRLSLRHSMPEGVVARLVGALGAEEAERLLVASDARAPVDVRANPAKCTAEALAARLLAEGVATRPLPVAGGLRVEGRHNLEGLAAFRDGWFEVQDLGSQQVAALVEPRGRVLDVCAGAGGKSLAFAGAGADVLALDVRGGALAELERRARRAGVRISTRRVPPEALPADLPTARQVVVDAPCTGTGTLRRHPESRWWLSEEEIAGSVATQRRLLAEAARQVEPGGRLVYAVCSVLPDEAEPVVASLTALGGWSVLRELRTWPQRDDCDGFYAAVLTRSP